MEALKRTAKLGVKDTMEFADGTTIELIGITARRASELFNNKKLSEFDRGIHLTAAKIQVNGQPVTYDDLLDCFTDEELAKIIKFANPEDEKNV